MKIVRNYPMSKVTTLGIGGPAKAFSVVKTEEELVETIKFAKEKGMDFVIIGGGSNLLVSDRGVNKLIIKNEVAGITSVHTGGMLSVKSGTPLQELVDFSISHSLSGLQKLTGIPGTVGGAVYGAVGAYGMEIIDHIVSVKTLSPNMLASEDRDFLLSQSEAILRNKKSDRAKQPKVLFLTKKDCDFGYRDSIFKTNKMIILEATFQLEPGNTEELRKEAAEILNKRLKKYPKGIKCPGSFFKNIVAETLPKEILDKIPSDKIVYDKIPAGSLLESVGAKGDKLNGIEIAPYHANLFINEKQGAAKDFYKLAEKYYRLVYQKFGIKLEPEVQLINLPPLQNP
ncbi:hypothetical protein A3F00_03380 [Candidatus Daviesbacteria bacterium RIFCSPHIGHO2_12_FULL_37_11]|uniref:UDP-N-acetylenolpyruvoylglucosamine reductase n=1 Tax=Candidatus Daviesbacteria bacterium RIFCSPHIGHO2_12_FULL_37_11 TaxID=1797777 RepID=A0A1F5KCV1_9BACT|nr:MAG: hypothetical protein A3F00_03380 [Candidatus Daviesbacteria bacterium RIFCSPHIGHO2_12_FULL_37_11]